ncbi:MAG: LapA family protein [Sporomusaceae bacterium]|jgi:uncharacterized integral membrane protein|nr:LapA family protein [Sporomusaceae bacterium]
MKYLIFSLVVAIVAGVFAVQNSMVVDVTFLYYSFQTSLVIVILMSVAVGLLMACPPALLVQFQLRRQISKLEKNVRDFENENKRLTAELGEARAIPQTIAAETKEETANA